MLRPILSIVSCVSLASVLCLAGCGSKDGGDTASASGTTATKSPTGSATGASATSTQASTSTGTATAAAAPYVSKEGGFQINFNGQTPKESVKDDPNGGTWKEASLDNGALIQYTTYKSPAEAVAEVQGFIPTREKETIKKDEPTTFEGLKGRDLELEFKSGKMFWIRFLIDGARVYKIGALFKPDQRAEAKAFVESFKLLAAPGAGSSASAGPSAAPSAGPAK